MISSASHGQLTRITVKRNQGVILIFGGFSTLSQCFFFFQLTIYSLVLTYGGGMLYPTLKPNFNCHFFRLSIDFVLFFLVMNLKPVNGRFLRVLLNFTWVYRPPPDFDFPLSILCVPYDRKRLSVLRDWELAIAYISNWISVFSWTFFSMVNGLPVYEWSLLWLPS